MPGPLQQRTALQRDTTKEVIRLLRVALRNVRNLLAGQPTDYQQWSLPQLERQIVAKLAEFERRASAAADTGMTRSWSTGKDLVDQALARVGGTAGEVLVATLPEISTRQLDAMRAFMTSKISDISTAAASKINEQLGLVIIGAQGPSDAIRALTKIFNGNRARAITIVRTELGRAFSTAAQLQMEEAQTRQPGLKKQWRSSKKVDPRPHHEAIDGQIREVDEPFTLGNGVEILYPRDPAADISETINCGCVSLPYMERWQVTTPGARPLTEEEVRARKSRGRRVDR